MSWILQIVGVALLSVLVDVLLPNGRINKFVKGVFSVILIFTVITPLSSLVATGKAYDVSALFSGYSEMDVDETYVSQANDRRNEVYSELIFSALKNAGAEVERVEITSDEETTVLVEIKAPFDEMTIKSIIRGHIGVGGENIVIVYGY